MVKYSTSSKFLIQYKFPRLIYLHLYQHLSIYFDILDTILMELQQKSMDGDSVSRN